MPPRFRQCGRVRLVWRIAVERRCRVVADGEIGPSTTGIWVVLDVLIARLLGEEPRLVELELGGALM